MNTIKKVGIVAAGAFAFAASAAVPIIDAPSVSIHQDRGRSVVIEYTMNPASDGDDEPAIITVDILTNAVGEVAASVGGEHLTTLAGDVNRIVRHTADFKHKILWNPTREGMGEWTLPAAQVQAKITAWSTNSPPAYWIIDLTHPADRLADRYYPNAEQIPLGVTNAIYKTDRLVFRRIPAKGVTWKMGKEDSATNYRYHYVTFSYDYWMAIYELTGSQYNYLKPSASGASSRGALPERCAFNVWRGDPVGASDYNWPSNGHDKVDGIMKSARTALGGVMVDLPTHSEWEFACRAGSSTSYCNGNSLSDVGWYGGNATGIQEVGKKKPNDWGMYDMHGNVAEWTLDKCTKVSADPVWDPTGPMQDDANTGMSGDYRNKTMAACGGGAWNSAGALSQYSSEYYSGGGLGLLKNEGQCAARLTILIQ